ncbi:2,3,4,5-tetrahydropyridine-2,6-dicarboxylate N-acetyltransferase [Bacillus methanolicus]|uniref:2,3,4,5-tetrahydropyridine-2,6-dicarboxylate N-acetyltransferase n=1 Tax=Bacillus methanolicus (strain MGA3 / ATCC 53907) TaxID=796606 RepID=I3DYT3_BACMM|nr:2,3,4,5-tetrahydropyridine-2,6-dicarboxylate N-acetyltransferase [Bacillus methanolicus]AIE59480.1 2,3,4,5-tetrahydropyridine-2,6-dicarboxylate N-acetyltransferase [Bacillus methanolicus MGA3]EIJ79404.1 Tetrahydrodipicolinate N-acetyltransferase [Bacillus methanolicus MGA3]UQD51542.1 2,3,4,5-tetrahydropyridine-2,6-dicarboxylate N-acetyltransferase [Bacillus methanolicus]
MKMMDANEIISFIQNSKKSTPVKVYVKGQLSEIDFGPNAKTFINGNTGVVFGEWSEINRVLESNQAKIEDYVIENDRRNSAIPLLNIKNIKARIEPGAIIRDQVEIGDNAVIMMGAVINIGAVVGEGTMIDMNAVLGGRATVGKNCHVGAGAVLAGVIEPPSAKPVVVEDDVVIGANAVVLEGVTVGKGAVVAAGAIVIEDVPPYTVVAGTPARVIKEIDEKTKSKTEIKQELRQL